MKLQLALDDIDLGAARGLLDAAHNDVDILEFGTPFVLRNGLGIVSDYRAAFPDLALLADIKIMDGGEYLANLAFDAGADYVTVLGVARDETISGAVRAAQARSRWVLADLIASPNPAARAAQLEALGVHGVCVHTGFEPGADGDQLQMLDAVRSVVTSTAVSVAGGVTAIKLPALLERGPDIVVVGSSVTASARPSDSLAELRAIVDNSGAR